VQNVVTYTVVVSAENRGLKLLPGMTADVELLVDRCDGVLKIPNAALRFQPSNTPKRDGVSGAPENRGSPGRGNPQQIAERMKRLSEQLDLSENQRMRIEALFGEVREKVMSLRAQGASPEEIRSQVQIMRNRNRDKFLAILNPEQREKFRLISTNRSEGTRKPGRIWILNTEGKPEPVEVILGISDGNFTEMVRGDLKEKQEVIVGIRQPVRNRSVPGGRGRFGF
jgi:HlyD family secretion protein